VLTSPVETDADTDKAKKSDASADVEVSDAYPGATVDASPDVDVPDAPSDTPDASPDAPSGDASPTRAAFGFPCTVGDDATCEDGLFCLEGPTGTAGFCSKTCPSTSSAACKGAPPGMAAYCVVTGVDEQNDNGCAFVCLLKGKTYPCPGSTTCETEDDPPGSGQRMCIP
jgi:hypothetical protein